MERTFSRHAAVIFTRTEARMSRHPKIRIVLVILSLGLPALAWGQSTPPAAKTPDPQTDQTTNIAYFTLRDGMNSTLTLNNTAPTPTKISVTVFNMDGRAQALDPVTLDPHTFKQIELGDVIKSDDFQSGNVGVAFNGTSMAVTAQVSVYSVEKRVSFESREQDMMDFESANLSGIVSIPRGAEAFLALTNVAKTNVSVQMTMGSRKKSLTLAPHETQMLKLNENEGDEGESDKGPSSMLVRLQHNALPGEIITTGFVWNLKDGYSSAFTMHDPRINRSNTLAGVHYRSGPADPSDGFRDGTIFRSPLFLANVGDKPVKARVSVNYTTQEKLQMTPVDPKKEATEEKASNVPVGEITIAPGEIQHVELPAAADTAEDSGVDVAYDGDPGAIIGQLTSVDQTGDYSFEVPIKDPQAMNVLMDGVYPWSIENGTNAVLHLKNTTAESQNGFVTFVLPDGATYRMERITLKPYQSIAVDIQKLKTSQKKDALKQVFPAKAVSGQVQWHPEEPYSMIGRLEETNAKEGIARSFSCYTSCCTNYLVYAFTSPASVSGPLGGSALVSSEYAGQACNGVAFGPTYISPQSWIVGSTAVATISATANSYQENVNYAGQGSTSVYGHNVYLYDYYTSSDGRCLRYTFYTNGKAAQVTVNPPTCTLNENFYNSKTPGDNLAFQFIYGNDCTESLGPVDCTSLNWWHWHMEGTATVSNDASRWNITRQLISDRRTGHYKIGSTLYAFDEVPIPTGSDGPPTNTTQKTAGQHNLFWIDAPGSWKYYGSGAGNPITDEILVMNFTDTIQSMDSTGTTCAANWHMKLQVDAAPALNYSASSAGYGWISTTW
jgi:hypothetical protein